MVEGVKRLTVMMLVSKPEARKTKLDHPDSIHEPPCLSADRDTSFDNDKRGRLVPKRGLEPLREQFPTRP